MIYLLGVVNFLMVGIFAIDYGNFPPQIPLFYSKPWGEDQLAEVWMIFLLPVLLDIFVIGNYFIVKKIFSGDPYVKKLLSYVNIFLVVVVFLIYLKIFLLIS
jgi:hypothetical protein